MNVDWQSQSIATRDIKNVYFLIDVENCRLKINFETSDDFQLRKKFNALSVELL